MKQWLVTSLGIVALFLAACTTEPTNPNIEPTVTGTPGQFFEGIPTFGVVELPSESALLEIDDTRLPIVPDPAGRALYDTHCATCHGANGEGQYPDEPYRINEQGLAGAPPHNPTGHTWHHPDQVLIAAIYNGQTLPNFQPMPAFKSQLSVDEIISILAYIKTWWGESELTNQYNATRNYQP